MYPLLKRIFDILFAAIGLIVLSPLLLPIILFLRVTAEGEVFYRQKRVGYQNRHFGIWKFATMLKNSPNMGTGSLTLRGDPRVTPIGRFLRKTKINELPQLINVLTGEMSFVGPRPQMQVDFDVYPPQVRETIYSVTPGITGIGSIVFRDEERLLSRPGIDPKIFYAEHIAPYKGALEMWYLHRRSFYVDFMILLLTAGAIITPSSDLHFKIFPDLPAFPEKLKA
ncbi:MAG: sugar transferase [Saprospiraceae bacterium]|nr:sugar transferase [Saprospiraceae bacterium]